MRVVTIAGDPEREATVAAALGARSDVEVVLRCLDRVEALASLRAGGLDAAIVVGDPIWFDHECAHQATRSSTRLVALSPDPLAAERVRSWGGVSLAFEATADEVVAACRSAPQEPARESSAAGPRDQGVSIAVWGPKGAPGASSIAWELASALAAHEPSTLLVDADTYGGDLLQLAGIVDELPTIVWATRMAAKRELDGRAIADGMRRTSRDGPVLLPGIPRADLWPEVSDFGLRELLRCARAEFRYLIADVGFCLEPQAGPLPDDEGGRNRAARAIVRDADRVVAVVRSDPIGIKSFLWAYEQLRDIVDDERVLVAANRVRSGENGPVSDLLKRYLGRRPAVLIPDDPETFAEAVARGVPVRSLRGGGDVTRAIDELVAVVGGRVRQRGFLARLGGRV